MNLAAHPVLRPSAAPVVSDAGGDLVTAQPSMGNARIAGLLYLGLAVCGIAGFLVIRPAVYMPDDAATTLTRLLEREGLARLGIAVEMGIVVTQALAALWFFRLFRSVDGHAAGAIAAFGLMNAAAILTSAALLGSAVQLAGTTLGNAATNDVQLMYVMSENLWNVGAIFFGLWLIPMGWCVLRSRWMPFSLGWLLVTGGVAYVCSAFVRYLAPGTVVVADALTAPATIAEFWMIGYLLVRGINTRTSVSREEVR